MKMGLLALAVLCSTSTAFAGGGIATMFSCHTTPDNSGKYFAFAISTRNFEQINVDVYSMKETNAADDEQLDSEYGIKAVVVATKSYANGRKLHGYGIDSDIVGSAKLFFAVREFDALAADTTGNITGKSVGHLDVGNTSEVIRCEY